MTRNHTSTKRDYLGRVKAHDKAEVAEIATKFGAEYWDGERHLGYGGYKYIEGWWLPIAKAMAERYGLKPGHKVLDVGCGKGFLLYELTRAVPGIEVAGLDVSHYAIANSKEEIRGALRQGHARELPYADNEFDFVVSINTLHNLYNYDLWPALKEIERVGKGNAKHITIEAYRNEREKVNLLYWQLTCRAFLTPQEWEWLFAQTGYSGDYGCIFFE
jgi:protein-L-isoaspartate(D-aspartate) O-methyltransferase